MLFRSSGADFHEWEDLARGGMWSPEPVRDEGHWVQLLKSGALTPIFGDEQGE